MKILMVVGQFYPIVGGAERQCLKLSKALQGRGHKVKVLTVRQGRKDLVYSVIKEVSVERVWYPIFYLFGRRIGFGFLAPVFMFWRVYRNAKHYDMLHVHQALWPAFSTVLAARLRHKSIVCKIGNSGERFDLWQLKKNHLYGRFAQWFVKKYIDKFIWTSKAVYDDLKAEKIPGGKLTYIPNGVEIPDILPHPARLSGPPSPPGRGEGEGDSRVHFIFTGTLTPKKNLIVLIEAIHQLPATYRDKLTLTILGDGPERSKLTQQVQTYKLADTILIPGSVENVGDYLAKSDVFVLPSLTEGLSNSALEAMAYGLPLILSRGGGNPDLVETEPSVRNGILVDFHDTEAFVLAIKYMIDNPEERMAMGKQSRIIVGQKYSIEQVVSQYEELYSKCIRSIRNKIRNSYTA